jgi:hypothetical protein
MEGSETFQGQLPSVLQFLHEHFPEAASVLIKELKAHGGEPGPWESEGEDGVDGTPLAAPEEEGQALSEGQDEAASDHGAKSSDAALEGCVQEEGNDLVLTLGLSAACARTAHAHVHLSRITGSEMTRAMQLRT